MKRGRGSPGVMLKVAEAPESDVGLGRARLDARTLASVGFGTAEVKDSDATLEICGKNITPARVVPLNPEDEGKGIIRIDGLVRRNAGVAVGDEVEVRMANPLQAVRVKFAPVISKGHKLSFGDGIENFVKRALLKRPLTRGDVVIVPGVVLLGGAIPFAVLETAPDGVVRIDDKTFVTLSEEPVIEGGNEAETSSAEDVLSHFVVRLELVRRAYETRIAQMEGEPGARARKLNESLRKPLEETTGLDAGTTGEKRD